MRNIHIDNSYSTWSMNAMKKKIDDKVSLTYGDEYSAETLLNRTYVSMYVEWWLHNLGYYTTKLLCRFKFFYKINQRCKDIDLEERLQRK